MAEVVLDHVHKTYPPDVRAVVDFTLTVRDAELLVLLGPSGCGKSTTLYMVAGLEDPDEGTIRIGDRRINDVPPWQRDIAMVFQDYALYPHMRVYDNLAFGLRMRRTPKAEIDRRVRQTADSLGIADLLQRKPGALSGGQRQRVALGRAIVRDPAVFLFDEPLSNLDAKLRASTRAELKQLHARLQRTALYVTHDQIEAMTLADRIAIMADGQIQQVGTPLEVYDQPANYFVADFIGTPPASFIEGEVSAGTFHADGVELALPARFREATADARALTLGLRPEDLALSPVGESAPLTGRVQLIEPLGGEMIVHLEVGEAVVLAKVDGRASLAAGETCTLHARLDRIHLFEQTGARRNVMLP